MLYIANLNCSNWYTHTCPCWDANPLCLVAKRTGLTTRLHMPLTSCWYNSSTNKVVITRLTSLNCIAYLLRRKINFHLKAIWSINDMLKQHIRQTRTSKSEIYRPYMLFYHRSSNLNIYIYKWPETGAYYKHSSSFKTSPILYKGTCIGFA